MAACLVLYDLGVASAEAERAFFDAIYEIAPDHWRVAPNTVLVGTAVSPGYLRDHLLHALAAKDAVPALLLVTRLSGDSVWSALSPEGEDWLREVLE